MDVGPDLWGMDTDGRATAGMPDVAARFRSNVARVGSDEVLAQAWAAWPDYERGIQLPGDPEVMAVCREFAAATWEVTSEAVDAHHVDMLAEASPLMPDGRHWQDVSHEAQLEYCVDVMIAAMARDRDLAVTIGTVVPVDAITIGGESQRALFADLAAGHRPDPAVADRLRYGGVRLDHDEVAEAVHHVLSAHVRGQLYELRNTVQPPVRSRPALPSCETIDALIPPQLPAPGPALRQL